MVMSKSVFPSLDLMKYLCNAERQLEGIVLDTDGWVRSLCFSLRLSQQQSSLVMSEEMMCVTSSCLIAGVAVVFIHKTWSSWRQQRDIWGNPKKECHMLICGIRSRMAWTSH